MLAATAAGLYPSLAAAAIAMDQGGSDIAPTAPGRYDRDYRILLEMQRQRRTIEEMR
jgi:ribulose kinase